jgi:hypothetical protein
LVEILPEPDGEVWIYDNDRFQPTQGNLKLSPNRPLLHAGNFGHAIGVAYEPTTPDANASSLVYFIPPERVGAITEPPAPAPVDCGPLVEAATKPLREQMRTAVIALGGNIA